MKTTLIKKARIRVIIVIFVMICSIISFLKIKNDSKRWVDADVTVKLPFEIDILSTGKSDFILIEVEGKFIIIDCGFYENSTKIKEFLNYKDVEEIEYLILSHNDKDHIGGAPIILDNFKINNLVQADYEKSTVQYKNYIEAVERNRLDPILLHSNIITNINGAKITIYPAIKDSYDKSNDYCIIVGVDYGKYRFLFAGDAEDERMKEFIEQDTGNYTFLKMAHHGIYNDEVGNFLESVSPSYAVITCSYFMYPDRKLISLLNDQKIKTFYTSSGDISIKSNGENIYFIQK
ncbi:MBL fold metallo-hydrolase [Clostridium sp. D53t1_180928_C8]|uniref:ComEC/Rec2 family competence protein n=1 Tax=Clostridium sp. D53t1_180928_C8 TaxID=2787101 RepID=UPI001FABD9C9|nr:MBL fold metallo-hydrolase [Clostridium sp. D53t1_180928_C8]